MAGKVYVTNAPRPSRLTCCKSVCNGVEELESNAVLQAYWLYKFRRDIQQTLKAATQEDVPSRAASLEDISASMNACNADITR